MRYSVLVGSVAGLSFATGVCRAQLQFTEATAASGLICNHPSGPYGQYGGIAVADFNRDGHQDMFLLCGGEMLYINDGTGFFTDQAAAWGLTGGYVGVGASAADFDRDGWIDIYVTSNGPVAGPQSTGVHRLYKNNAGASFTNVADAAGVRYTSFAEPGGFGSAWGDYDLDGDLDLCVVQWTNTAPEHNRLYRNNNDGTFTDVTAAALGNLIPVWGFQPVFIDMNGDRYPELLIAADFESSRYFRNNGNGTFTDYTIPGGLGIDDNGMGTTVGDMNNDLLPDWYVTSIHYGFKFPGNPGNMLYINQGGDSYTETSVASGCNDGGWGWGTVSADLDQDGWMDIIEVNGRGGAGVWNNEQAYVFRNTTAIAGATPTFQEVAITCGMAHYANQTSVVAFDADNDGDLDVMSYATGSALKFFENTTVDPGAWLKIVFDTANNPQIAPEGFGTSVEVTAGGKSLLRIVDGGPTYLATCGAGLHFGLDDATIIDTLRVKWSRGYDTIFSNVAVNQTLVIQPPAPGDLTGDGSVNVFDLFEMLDAWGPCGAGTAMCPSDLNSDHEVNVFDLFILLDTWG